MSELYWHCIINLLFLILEMMGIGQMYRASHKMTNYGIEGYQVEKKYQETHKVLKQKNEKQPNKEDNQPLKRGHHHQDHVKVNVPTPGPGEYDYKIDPWSSSRKASKNKIKPSKKQTFFEELMEKEKKQNRPAPGQYRLFLSQQELKAEKERLARRKVNVSERITYLDAVQYQASNIPGVGAYTPLSARPRSATMRRQIQTQNGNRPSSAVRRVKQPQAGTYNPQNIDKPRSFSKKSKGYHQWGRVDRFKSNKTNVGLGPGSYAVADEAVASRRNRNVYYS